MHEQFNLQTIETNGITLRAAVEGDGPLVIMVHGWPELWYSWRHQIKPITQAGYRVVAPDVRGYGGSDKPHPVEAYDMASLMADVVGIVDAFGEEKAILIGHDWGAATCWNTAALHPERVSAVAGLSVPYFKRGEVSTIELFRRVFKDRFFYQIHFQEEGVAEAELEADVHTSLRKVYYSVSGDGRAPGSQFQGPTGTTWLDGLSDPEVFPAWLTPDDLDYFAANFEASGFRRPINRYRNQDRDFDNLPDMGVAPVAQPSCFIGGAEDLVRYFVPGRDPFEDAGRMCTDFRFNTIIDGIGHWVQQEAPDEVNAALLEFLASLT